MRRLLVNNLNTGINLSTVINESKNDNLNIHDQSGSTNATAAFATSNETFFVSQTPSVSSSKVEYIEEESHKRKESISGNRIDVNILGLVMVLWYSRKKQTVGIEDMEFPGVLKK